MPRAMSRAIEPVGMTSIGARTSSPRRITEPLPNWRSIWASAASSALSRFSEAMSAVPFDWRVDEFDAFFTSGNLRSTADRTSGRDRICGGRDPGDITEQVFDAEADTPGTRGATVRT